MIGKEFLYPPYSIAKLIEYEFQAAGNPCSWIQMGTYLRMKPDAEKSEASLERQAMSWWHFLRHWVRCFSSLGTFLKLSWWLRWERICLQCGRPGFDPWIGKIPWRRAWQHPPVFLTGESPWTEESGGLQSMGSKRVRHDCVTNSFTLSLLRL